MAKKRSRSTNNEDPLLLKIQKNQRIVEARIVAEKKEKQAKAVAFAKTLPPLPDMVADDAIQKIIALLEDSLANDMQSNPTASFQFFEGNGFHRISGAKCPEWNLLYLWEMAVRDMAESRDFSTLTHNYLSDNIEELKIKIATVWEAKHPKIASRWSYGTFYVGVF